MGASRLGGVVLTASTSFQGEMTLKLNNTQTHSGSADLDIQVGDLDGDGDLDVAFCEGLEDFQILLNDGSGGFSLNSTAPSPANMTDIGMEIVDFDGDGFNDIISSERFAGNIVIFWGDGSGTFGASLYQTGYGGAGDIYGFVVQDFDGDSNKDILFTRGSADDLLLCPGGGLAKTLTLSGSCTSIALGAGDNPGPIATGLLDGDANYDLVVGIQGSDQVRVMLGDGAGGFPTNNLFPLTATMTPYKIALGDLTGDTNLDIVVSTRTDDTIERLYADDGTATSYTLQASIVPGDSRDTYDVEIADIDNDTVNELTFVTRSTNNGALMSVYENDGAGGLTLSQNVALGGRAFHAIVADLNGTGGLDMVVAANPSLVSLAGAADGTFPAPAVQYALGSDPNDLKAADIDGDGDTDLILVDAADDTIEILRNNGDATFQARVTYPTLVQANRITVGDFDGDGDEDIAVSGNSSEAVRIHANDGTGVFTVPYADVALGDNAYGIVAGDWDNNNVLDLAVDIGAATDQIEIYRGDGAGGFTIWNTYPTAGSGTRFVVGDLDGDGNLDLVQGTDAGADSRQLMGNGDGSFVSSVLGLVTSTGGFALADFNNDDYLDLFHTHYYATPFHVRLNDGAGDISADTQTVIGVNIEDAATVDMDLDGYMDVVTASNHGVRIYYGDGAGSFVASKMKAIRSEPGLVGIVVTDLNGDGKRDIAVMSNLTNTVQIILAL